MWLNLEIVATFELAQSINQSINQSTNQFTNQPIDHSINQLTNNLPSIKLPIINEAFVAIKNTCTVIHGTTD